MAKNDKTPKTPNKNDELSERCRKAIEGQLSPEGIARFVRANVNQVLEGKLMEVLQDEVDAYAEEQRETIKQAIAASMPDDDDEG